MEPTHRVTRRFYWELAGLRAAGANGTRGPSAAAPRPIDVLADPRLDGALRALRHARPGEPLRVACMIELAEKTPTAPILRARAALARHEIALDLWPQLPHDDEEKQGARFLNTSTAATFQTRLLPLLDELEKSGDGSDVGLALDLEPNEHLVRAAWSARDPGMKLVDRARAVGSVLMGVGRAVVDARQGRRDLTELARDLAARDLPVHVAVLPQVALATAPGGDVWRTWTLGCPVVDVEGAPLFGLQAAMCYAPLARRLPLRNAKAWDREAEKKTLALWAARHRAQFDAVVVGQTATGILGDEPVYDDARVFAEDVRAMDALGFTDVAVYALEGIFFGRENTPPPDLRLRPDVETWIGAAFGDA